MDNTKTTTSITTNNAMPKPENIETALGSINRELEEKTIAEYASSLGLDYVDLSQIPIKLDYLSAVPEDMARMGGVFPFFRLGKKIRIAIADPKNIHTKAIIENLKKNGFLINLNLCSRQNLKEALKYYDQLTNKKIQEHLADDLVKDKFRSYEEEIKNLTTLKEKIASVTSEEALNTICIGALKTGASDIHFQPEKEDILLRFRIDGMLQDIFRISHKIFDALVIQVKYSSHLKINIKDIPQDGRFSFPYSNTSVDVRVSTLPGDFGESIVLRLLHSNVDKNDLDKMGFSQWNLIKARNALKNKNGIILVTGPTGSGKTTTLYTMLQELNKVENKIITLEDPVEYRIPRITQSQIDEEKEYTFEKGLRAILRQDPDIILVGEIRDLATGETAAQAALTGHLVFSTLHTNDAVETITRMLAIGVKSFVLAPALKVIFAQRLIRTVCKNCVVDATLTEHEEITISKTLEEIQRVNPEIKVEMPKIIKRAIGCERCNHTGYRGRAIVSQILEIDSDFREAMLQGKNTEELHLMARQKGLLTLREDAILKVCEGMTTLSEAGMVGMF